MQINTGGGEMITKIEPGTDKLNLTINAEIDITQYDYPCASPHLDFEVDEKSGVELFVKGKVYKVFILLLFVQLRLSHLTSVRC